MLNTLNDLAASCNYALRAYGLPEHSVDDVRRFVGNGVRLLMTRAIPGGESYPEFEACYACFREHYLHHNLDTTAPYPGIMEMLKTLLENDRKVAVVSNKFYQATQDLVISCIISFLTSRWLSVSALTSTRSRHRIP